MKPERLRASLAALTLTLSLALAACGGGSGDDAAEPPPPEASATLGAAGGALALPDGAALVVPAGALQADVKLRIVKRSTGAPTLPAELGDKPAVYEITPHDTRFLTPVQVRLPLPAGAASDAAALVATSADGWATQPARVENGMLVLERTALSWYAGWPGFQGCAAAPGNTDPFPCRVPIVLMQPTATPAGAVDSSLTRVSRPVHLALALDFRAHPDCNDARVAVQRRHRQAVANAPTTTTTLADLSLPMQDVAGSPLGRSATWTLALDLDHRDNGYNTYDVRFSCTRGHQSRRVATLSQLSLVVEAPVPADPPLITRQPADTSVIAGREAGFSVDYTGNDVLSSSWQRSNDGGSTWLELGGGVLTTTGSGYVFTAAAADNGSRYRAVVCNGLDARKTCVRSDTATFILDVLPTGTAPQITQQPADQTLSANGDATFSAAASGTPPVSITWNAGNGHLAPGAGGYTEGACSFDYDAQGGTLALGNATLGCVGMPFYAVATNGAGSVATQAARLVASGAVALLVAGEAGTRGAVDGPLLQARFSTPNYLAMNSSGQLAVADFGNRAVRIVAAGDVSTLAGALGQAGYVDATGTQARFGGLGGMGFDGAGNLYVADWDNHVIRRVTPAGVVSTLAGSAGVAGSADGSGAAARFRNPNGLAVDAAGNVYVADWGNHTIRAITPAGVVTTLAGSPGLPGSANGSGPAARFSLPSGLALRAPGELVVADQGNHVLRSVSTAGVVTTLAGAVGLPGEVDGTAASARFVSPAWVATSADGRVFVVSGAGDTVRRVALDGSVQTLVGVAGDSAAVVTGLSPRLRNARGLWVAPTGNDLLLAADHALLRIVLP